MAQTVLWMESWDYINTSGTPDPVPYELAIGDPSVSSSYARTGANGVRFGLGSTAGYYRKNLGANYANLTIGSAVRISQFGNSGSCGVIGFGDAGTQQCAVVVNSAGQVFLITGGTIVLGPSGVTLPLGSFHYVELYVSSFGNPGGAFIYVDGGLVLSGAVQTEQTGNAYANQFYFGMVQDTGGIILVDEDDGYVLTGGGVLGDCSVVCEFPDASGTYTQWTPVGSPANWQNVDANPVAVTPTTYNEAGASGLRDNFGFPTFPPASLTNVGTIVAVMVMEYGEADSAGTCAIELTATQAGTDAFSNLLVLGVGWIYQHWIFQTDVNGNPWITSNLNATDFGYERIL